MDPEDGKVYRAELWAEGGALKVRGYLGPFYRTQTWVKAKSDPLGTWPPCRD